ncbi:MAG: phosphotransferase family protein [Gammaproteobacteria bacterium]|nr:phosphotransferase family protein [Gammaproteobacteria bacterium]MDH3767938.1 phosphotransferase family protein [Gammaproteobacteria bacterium]
MSGLDRSSEVRRGEELSATALREYLQNIVPEVRDGLEIRQFPGGFSNLTYLLRAGDRELVLRRPPHGANIASAHDMSREYRVLSALIDSFRRVPAPVHYCDDVSVIGTDFYLMKRLKGTILRANQTEDVAADADTMRKLSESFIACLAELHSIDPNTAGLRDLGRPEGYVTRQVAGWIRRYQSAATDVIPEMETTAIWLTDNLPSETATTLIHNDFKYDNLVLDIGNAAKIIGVLDWEMATIGDPMMDLGSSLAYWAQADDPPGLKNFSLTWLPGNYSRRKLINRYADLSGRNTDEVLFYYRFGLYKLAVILQQIYARYRAGHTKDPRFAQLIEIVRVCAQQSLHEEV